MSTLYHTDIAYQAAANAATVNAPLGQLDQAIANIAAQVGASALPISTTDGTAAAGQKVIPVDTTTGWWVSAPFFIGDIGGTYEAGVVASIQAGVSLTATSNLTGTYAAGKTIGASPAEVALARAGFTDLNARLSATSGTSGTVFPGGPVATQLFRRTDRAGALYVYDGAAWQQTNVPAVSAFWGTPTTNDRCYRTDRGIEYFYDGTRWLSSNILRVDFAISDALAPFAATANMRAIAPTGLGGYSAWLLQWDVTCYITAPNDATTNYWVGTLVRQVGGTTATIATISTATVPDATGTVVAHSAALNTSLAAASVTTFKQPWTKTGAPGALYATSAVWFRLVG